MRADPVYNKNINAKTGNSGFSPFIVKNNPGIELLDSQGNEDLINYLEWLNLRNDPNLVVISSFHHYFYDAEEMKNVKTIVSMIYVNEVREIKSFLHSIYTTLTPKSNLIGFFHDSKNHNGFSLKKNNADDEAVENGIMSKIPFLNALYNLMDSKTNRNLSKSNVIFLLENNGFKVQDITELNGISYFHAKRI